MKALKDVLLSTAAWFKERGIPSARLDAELLVGHVLGLDRVKVYLAFDRPLTDDELERLRPLVRRRGNREPLAWILGHKEFYGRDFVVTPGVLVPRPDTETLVEAALEWLPSSSSGDRGGSRPPRNAPPVARKVLPWSDSLAATSSAEADRSAEAAHGDAGTVDPHEGAHEHEGPGGVAGGGSPPLTADSPSASGGGLRSLGGLPPPPLAVLGSLSPRALRAPPQEKEGEKQLDAQTEPPIYVADIGSGTGCIGLTLALERPAVRLYAVDRADEPLAATKANVAKHGLEKRVAVLRGDLLAAIPTNRPIDWIVSNPPYIPVGELAGLEPEVRDHEPRGALEGGADGLEVYRRLVPAAAARARKGVLVEVGAGQAQAVAAMMTAAGLPEVRVWKDLAGIERVVGGRR